MKGKEHVNVLEEFQLFRGDFGQGVVDVEGVDDGQELSKLRGGLEAVNSEEMKRNKSFVKGKVVLMGVKVAEDGLEELGLFD